MHPSSLHYFPLAAPFFLALLVGLALLVVLIELRILRYAYERIGINRHYVFALLLASLLGSYVNIPVAELPPEQIVSNKIVTYFGVHYVVPEVEEWPRTIIAVNLGGAVIPTLLSLYLLIQNQLFLRAIVAVAVVTLIVHLLAKPVPGVGISVPIFVPPLIAAGIALILSWQKAPQLAYIAGSLGTLIGADLLNLDKIQGLGAPVASIGGAGTFDGIFVTGILAVLLAPAASPRYRQPERRIVPLEEISRDRPGLWPR
jgi:uncharacterized membrane protein